MNNSMVPMRTVIWLSLILIGLGFWLGPLYWNKDPYKCWDVKKQPYGQWVTVLAIGKFELRLKEWGCKTADRYDPKEFQSLYKPQKQAP